METEAGIYNILQYKGKWYNIFLYEAITTLNAFYI